MYKKNIIVNIIFLKIFTVLFLFFLPFAIFAQEPCETKYPDDGKCKTDCEAGEYHDDTAGLCATGKCCHKYAAAVDLALQVPIFQYTKAENIAEYLVKIYNVSLFVIIPIIILVIIYSGIMWIFAGVKPDLVQKSKSQIINAFIGLGLILSSYIILSVFRLTELRAPQIEFIKPIEVIPEATYTNITGQPVKSKSEYYALGEQIAKEKGLHPCFMKVMIDMESGGRANVIGHDENARNEAAKKGKVPARREFLKSGKTFKGVSFSPMASAPYDSTQKNDDTPVCDKEDLCLDWRWSHGIGLSQFTISGTVASTALGKWCKSGVPSRAFGGKCYTAKELFDPKVSLGIGADMLKRYPTSRAYAGFKAYNGSDEYARDAKARFDKCCAERGGC